MRSCDPRGDGAALDGGRPDDDPVVIWFDIVRKKGEACEAVGLGHRRVILPATATAAEVRRAIRDTCDDRAVHGESSYFVWINRGKESIALDLKDENDLALLQRMDDAARSSGGAMVQVVAGYADSRKRILVANTDGVLVTDEQVRTLIRVSAVADGDAGMQTGAQSAGHTMGFELFDTVDVDDLARDAARIALSKLDARPAPSGALPVVIKRGSGGVLFHEACGHGLEADLVAKGGSVYRGKKGELVASPLVTLVDDGTMSGEWGAIGIDDEGHQSQRNVLIENGLLTDYMWDYLRARKEGRPQSGNGRRQSYMHLPMVRMTNTYVLNGADDPDDIVRGVERGIYCVQLGGGQVDPATGDFVFGMTEAYLIEGGRITEPLREGNLIGNGPQVLRDIDLLGNDFAMGNPGTCGKDGQGVPVGDGQPTLRVKTMTIGGTAA